VERVLAGDVLLFARQTDANVLLELAEGAIVLGEELDRPGVRLPYFVHVGIALSDAEYAEEDGTAHAAPLSGCDRGRRVYVKRLPLTPDQRARVPDCAKSLYGERYDYVLDLYLGIRYAWKGLARGLRDVTHGALRLPPCDIGSEEPHRLICTTFDRDVLRAVGYPIPKRFPSPEYFALLPGPLWKLPGPSPRSGDPGDTRLQ